MTEALFSGDGTRSMPVSFSFEVCFLDTPPGIDCSFQEVSGLDVRMETEDVRCGGENGYVYKLPKGVQQDKLVLKRGVADIRSPLMLWCKATLEGGLALPVFTRDVCVFLRDAQGIRIRGWVFTAAFPVRWSVDEFNSTKNDVVIETIELAYLQCSRGL